jgi:general secretion pathway protein H
MNKAHDQGFTLLELIVVVLLIALALGVVYPSMTRGNASLHLKSCGRDVLNVFRYAREKAVTDQTGTIVAIDKDQQIMELYTTAGDQIGKSFQMPSDVQITRFALGGNEVVDSNLILVRFLANGSADEAEVLLKSKYGAQLKVVSDPMRGGGHIETIQ